MAGITDYIITTADVQEAHVEAQPTVLHGSATDNKKVFDKYSDMITAHFNGLVGYLEQDKSTVVAQSVQTLYESLGWVQD